MLVWLTLPFYDFCGFRSVAVNSVYKLQFFTFISDISRWPIMAMTRRRLHSSNYAVSEQVVKPREPRGETFELSTRRPPRPQSVSGQFVSK